MRDKDVSMTDGAYFRFGAPPQKETFVIKLIDPELIQQARKILSEERIVKIHVSGRIVKEPVPYNPPWSFHLDPLSIRFFELAAEVCDAAIQFVEDHLDEVGGSFLPGNHWCPWPSRLIEEVEYPLIEDASENLVEIRRLEGHKGAVHSCAFSEDGRQALSGGFDRVLRLWDLDEGKILRLFEGHKEAVNSVAFSHNSCYALSGSSDHTVHLWDINSGTELHIFEGHKDVINSVTFSPDDRYFLSGSSDNSLRLWDIEKRDMVYDITKHCGPVQSVVFSPDGRYALSASEDHFVGVWDIKTGNALSHISRVVGPIFSVDIYSKDGPVIFGGSEDIDLWVWNLKTGGVNTLRGHTQTIRSVVFSRSGFQALSGSDDESVRLWDVENKREIGRFDGHKGAILCVALSPDVRLALSASADESLSLLEIHK